jgi:hypothetical protein
MPDTADSVLLVVEFICGAAAGIALGRWVRSYSLGWVVDGLIGGIGGVLLVLPAARMPMVGRLLGHVETAADATMRGVGGLTPTVLIGSGIVGLLGGLVLALLAGFVKTLTRA